MEYTNIIPELVQRREQFLSCMNDIENYVDTINGQKGFFREIDKNGTRLQKEYVMNMKKLDGSIPYRAIIIGIYGNFENYVVDISKLLIDGKGKVYQTLNEFPDSVKQNYITQCAHFIAAPNRYSRFEITKEDIFKSLFENGNGFITNLTASHGGNFKIEQIAELLKNVGINQPIAEIKNSQVLRKYFAEEQDISIEQVGGYIESAENIFFQLDRLVEARNQVAHNWYIDDRISMHDILSITIPYIKCIAETINDIVIGDYLQVMYEKNRMNEFVNVIEIINGNILCIDSQDSKLEKMDYLLYQHGTTSKFSPIQIQNIQIDGKNIDNVECENVNIGLKVSSKIKKDGHFFYLVKNN